MAQYRINSCFFTGILLLYFAFLHQNVQGIKKFQLPKSLKLNRNSLKSSENEVENESKVTFQLYNNNQDVNETTELFVDDRDRLLQSPFIPNAPLIILIHGFMSSGQFYSIDIKNAYLQEENGSIVRNIVIVDWKELAALPMPIFVVNTYIVAATRNVPLVGRKVGKLISFLVENNMTSLDSVHIVGHSLGAHCSGIAGNSIQEKYGQSVDRITGLDPAGPLFYSHVMGRPLTLKDAKLVDIVHTDAFVLGKAGKIGHADFFPNGGTLIQTGCLGNNTFGTGLVKEILTLGTNALQSLHF